MQWHDLKQTEDKTWEYDLPDGRRVVSTFKADDIAAYLYQQVDLRIAGAHARGMVKPNRTENPCVFHFDVWRTKKPEQTVLDALLRHGLKVTLPTEYESWGEGVGRIEITADLWFKKLFTVVERTPADIIADLRKQVEAAQKSADQWQAAAESARRQLSTDEQRIEALTGALRQYVVGKPPIQSTSKIGLIRSPEETKRFHGEIDAMRLEGWHPTTINHLYTDEGVRVCVWLEREALPDGVIEQSVVVMNVLKAAEAVVESA